MPGNLLPENEEAFLVWSLARNQVVVDMGNVITLDFNALRFIMDLYDVQDRRRCFEGVMTCFEERQTMRAAERMIDA